MENSNGSSNFKSYMYAGQQSLLPPRIPFPSAPPSSYFDYGSSSSTISKGSAKQRQGLNLQRTSSESFLMDEQPSWVEELLNEPETPVRKGHRRSSSDSFAYFNPANAFNMDSLVQADHELRNKASLPRRGSQDFDHYNNVSHASLYQEPNYFMRQKGATWESPMNSMAYSGGLRDNAIVPSSGFSCSPQEPAEVPSAPAEKQEQDNSWQHDPKVTGERRDFSNPKPSGSDTDPKRAKQQFAQRSRVRKLQYIAELERNVQALQVEGSGVAAEIEFLDQQNLILNMENKALKQRLDGLTQEQLIKCLEQEMLEREISRLRILYQQQQQPQQQQQRSSHRRSSSRDNLDSQFASLSLKHETGSGRDPVRI